jgi:hypothetical protein
VTITSTETARERRSVYVVGTCGHRWVIRTRLTNDQIGRGGEGSYTAKCAECREAGDPFNRRVQVVEKDRCAKCGTKLAAANESDICGACEYAIRIKARDAMPGLADDLAAERTQVLRALPGRLPEIVLASGVRWVRVVQVLDAALRRGEVVAGIGRDRIYKLVAVLEWEGPRHADD